MTTKDEALKLALAVLKEWRKGFPDDWTDFDTEAVTAIEEALTHALTEREQPEQHTEPCGWRMKHNGEWVYSFTKDAWDFIYAVSPAARKAARDNAPAQQQEPVAWITQGGKGWLRWHNKNDDHLNKTSVPLYKHPKRKPLSDAEIALISAECSLRTPSDIYFARAIEAAHGIKGDA